MNPPQNVKFTFENDAQSFYTIPTPMDLPGTEGTVEMGDNKIGSGDPLAPSSADFNTPSTDAFNTPSSIGRNDASSTTMGQPSRPSAFGGASNTKTPQFFKELISPIQQNLHKSPSNLFFATPVGKSFLDNPSAKIIDTPAFLKEPTPNPGPMMTSSTTSTTPTRQEQEFLHHQATNEFKKVNPLTQDKTQFMVANAREFLSVDPNNYTIVSPQNFTVVSNKIELIEGFNQPVVMKVPGGKGNTKDCIPRQVVELKLDQFPNVDPTSLSCTCEVLGFDRKSNSMVPLGQVMKKSFIQTTDKRFLAVFDHCVVKYSSHLNGQKLALRFSLISKSNGQHICFVDSKHFQTITQRGREKQAKRKRKRDDDDVSELEPESKRFKISTEPWTAIEISHLLSGTQQYGENWEVILQQYNFRPSRTAEHLRLKFDQLLSP